jgi:site-specific DNA-methyltransferase (adenine-specific)
MSGPDVEIIHGDCLDRMREIEAGSIDLVLADLPYGTTACEWDVIIPFDPLWAHYRRLLKPKGAVVLTASQPFTSMLVMSNREWFRYCWIWRKPKPTGFLDARRKPLKDYEDIVVFMPRLGTYNPQGLVPVKVMSGRQNKAGRGIYGTVAPSDYVQTEGDFPRAVIDFNHETNGVHPTQKPVALMEYLVRTYSNEGETVLDNAMGSGTTGVACVNAGRRFIGIEIDAEMVKVAEARIADARLRLERPHAPPLRFHRDVPTPLFDSIGEGVA